jgi:hypothetical protein
MPVVKAYLHGGKHLMSDAIICFHFKIAQMVGHIETLLVSL